MRKLATAFTKALTLAAALTVVAAGTAWWAYGEVGKTPGELMDYAELRQQGHNKLEWVALPAMAQANKLAKDGDIVEIAAG